MQGIRGRHLLRMKAPYWHKFGDRNSTARLAWPVRFLICLEFSEW